MEHLLTVQDAENYVDVTMMFFFLNINNFFFFLKFDYFESYDSKTKMTLMSRNFQHGIEMLRTNTRTINRNRI